MGRKAAKMEKERDDLAAKLEAAREALNLMNAFQITPLKEQTK